jgi:hypothetical protein
MRSHLAVTTANLEAFLDAKLEPTAQRLRAVLQALNELDVLLNDVGKPFSPRGDLARDRAVPAP